MALGWALRPRGVDEEAGNGGMLFTVERRSTVSENASLKWVDVSSPGVVFGGRTGFCCKGDRLGIWLQCGSG